MEYTSKKDQHVRFIDPEHKVYREIKNKLGSNASLLSSIIKKAREYTGLKSEDPKVLLRNIKKIKAREQKQAAKEAEKARKEAEAKEAKHFRLSIKEYRVLSAKARKIGADFSTGYSMGEVIKVYLKNYERPLVVRDDTSSYSGDWEGRETHGLVKIIFTKKDLREIERIEGVWTIRGQGLKAKWLESQGRKQYFKLLWKEGYLIGSTHGATKEEALTNERAKKRAVAGDYSDNDFIGVQDIRKLGACWPGIKSFCQRHGLNPEYGYRIGYLKKLNGAGTPYFNHLTRQSK